MVTKDERKAPTTATHIADILEWLGKQGKILLNIIFTCIKHIYAFSEV